MLRLTKELFIKSMVLWSELPTMKSPVPSELRLREFCERISPNLANLKFFAQAPRQFTKSIGTPMRSTRRDSTALTTRLDSASTVTFSPSLATRNTERGVGLSTTSIPCRMCQRVSSTSTTAANSSYNAWESTRTSPRLATLENGSTGKR